MQPLIRPVTALILIGFLIYNSLGYLLVIPAVKAMHRQHFQASLHSKQRIRPETFVFKTGTEKAYLKNGSRELSIGGKMYDIVEKKVEGSKTIYVCVRDTREEKINGLASGKGMHPVNAASPPVNQRLVFDQIIKIAEVGSHGDFIPVYSYSELSCFHTCSYSDPPIQVPDHPPCPVI